jgi:ATP-dependent helicase IRC3
MRVELRPYQLETLERSAAAEARGVRRQAINAATGLGKTVMFCALAERRGGRTLILAHRDELIEQAAAKVVEVWPDANVGVVKAARNETGAQVVVASVQTLARPARLDALVGVGAGFFAREEFDLVVVDECHHSAAESYVRILEALNAGEPDGPLLLGVTATLDRGDGKGLDHLFEEVVADWPILWGIQQGYLCDLAGQRVHISTLDLSKVKVTAGDYNQGAAGRALEDAGAPEAIAAAWMNYAQDRRKTLVFTPTVETAVQTADAFAQWGVKAAWVSGETPIDDRRAILRGFSDGTYQVLANCAVLTEGYDEPGVDCVVVARPTKSRALYTQMVGRGTRRHPDKTDCLVLDVAGVTDIHSLVSLPSLFGVEDVKEFEERGEGVAATVEREAMEKVALGRITAEEADLFKVVRQAGITWVPVHEPGADRKRFVRPLGQEDCTVVLAQLDADRWGVGVRLPALVDGKWRYGDGGWRTIIRDVSQETAQSVAEDFIRKHPSRRLATADAAWRQNRPTPRMIAFAERLKIKVDKGMTGGQVSDAIDAVIAVRNEREANTK